MFQALIWIFATRDFTSRSIISRRSSVPGKKPLLLSSYHDFIYHFNHFIHRYIVIRIYFDQLFCRSKSSISCNSYSFSLRNTNTFIKLKTDQYNTWVGLRRANRAFRLYVLESKTTFSHITRFLYANFLFFYTKQVLSAIIALLKIDGMYYFLLILR